MSVIFPEKGTSSNNVMIKYVASHQGYNILTSRSKSRSIGKDIPQGFQTMYQFLLLITTWLEEGLFFLALNTFLRNTEKARDQGITVFGLPNSNLVKHTFFMKK